MQFFFTAFANLDHFQQAPSSFAGAIFLLPCGILFLVVPYTL